MTHCSQAPSTFSHQENVACLVFAAKHSLDRSHTSSMKLWTQGKGLMVLSAIHHYLDNYGLNATRIHLNADNCSGRNKNNALMQYLAWRVLTQRNLSIKISFGHTKFAPDSCFGLFKQRFRRTSVSSLEDIAAVMNDSSVVNFAQLVGTSEGKILVQSYDWTGFFSKMFRKIDGIKQYHHFSFEEEVHSKNDFVVLTTKKLLKQCR